MNRLHKHIPNFVDDRGADRTPFEFETLEELKNLEWVKGFIQNEGRRKFDKLVHNDGHLMAVYDDGEHWWVIGHLEQPVEGLEAWDHGKYKVWSHDGRIVTLRGVDVRSSCGSVVTASNGKHYRRYDPDEPKISANEVRDVTPPEPFWFRMNPLPERVVFPVFGTRGW